MVQGRQDQTCRSANPRTGFPGIPYAVRVLSLLKFLSWPGGGRVTVDLLECAFDCGEVSLFHGVNDFDGPLAVLHVVCMHIFGRTLDLSSEGQLLYRTTENVPCTTRAFVHRNQSVLRPSGCRWSWQLLRRGSCGAPDPLSSRVCWRPSFRRCSQRQRSASVLSVRRGPFEVDGHQA